MNPKTGKIFLIGGGSLSNGETDFIEEMIVHSVNKQDIHILMLNYANSTKDDTNYRDKFREAYKKYKTYNIHIEQLCFSESLDNTIKRQKIQQADIIYLGGGNTLQLQKALKRNGVFKDILHGYLSNHKILVGRSAGTLIFFEKFLTEKGPNTSEIGLFSGFGFLRGICSVHLSEYNECAILEKFVLHSGTHGVGMDECTCLIIEGGKFITLNKENTKIYKYLSKDGHIEISSVIHEDFVEMNYLYS